ncbi:MAG: hypothetical protein QOJ64_2466 [Acidobacteriota bacterium]|jgi:DNA repair photolyase|nr:hypothetical protein [Acidobacteriota bacterium]
MRYIENPPNPYISTTVEWTGEPPPAKLEIFEETETRSIINKVDSPDVHMTHTVNVYRGCAHGCTYCFARPTHEYLGWGAGTDFERKLVVKVRAPELLRAELMRPSWKGSEIAFSFTSDPYVPVEFHYGLTRKCLEVCHEFLNPVSVITKSGMIVRDIDVLVKLVRDASASVFFSIPFKDYETARAIEPFAPSPAARFKAMAALASAGVPVGLSMSPLIPGLNDSHIPEILARAKEAGARKAFMSMLRLPGSVGPYFVKRLEERLPTKARRVLNHIREERGGKLNSSVFGERMHGTSEQWKLAVKSFELHCSRLGLNEERQGEESAGRVSTFRRPTPQGTLF